MIRRPRYYRLVGRTAEPTDDVRAWGIWFETASRDVARTQTATASNAASNAGLAGTN